MNFRLAAKNEGGTRNHYTLFVFSCETFSEGEKNGI